MKRFFFATVIFFCGFPNTAVSQSNADVSDMPYSGAPCTAEGGVKPSASQIAAFTRFDAALRSAIKRNDAAALAFLVHFPLRVNTSKGTLLIPDAQSLSGHYAEIFPLEVREKILSTVPKDFICGYDEGLAYKDGVIWVSTGDHKFTIDAVNTTNLYAKADKPELVYTCETKTHRISIEDLNDGKSHFRYRSWNKPRELSDAPDAELATSTLHFEGTGVCSYAVYSFAKGNVVYEVDRGLGCGDGTEPTGATGELRVTVADKVVLHDWCF